MLACYYLPLVTVVCCELPIIMNGIFFSILKHFNIHLINDNYRRKITHLGFMIGMYFLGMWAHSCDISTLSSFDLCLISFASWIAASFRLLIFMPSIGKPLLGNWLYEQRNQTLFRDSDIDTFMKDTLMPALVTSPVFIIIFTILWKYGLCHFSAVIHLLSLFGDALAEMIAIFYENNGLTLYCYSYYDVIYGDYHQKSLQGNIACFIGTLFMLYIIVSQHFIFCDSSNCLLYSCVISFGCAFVEGLSPKGFDNYTLLLYFAIVLYFFGKV